MKKYFDVLIPIQKLRVEKQKKHEDKTSFDSEFYLYLSKTVE